MKSTDIFGKGDGVSNQTKAGFVRAGLTKEGDYPDNLPPPPPPPPPPPDTSGNQMGSLQLENEKKLKEMLIKRGSTPEQADRQISEHKKAKGYR